VKAAVPVVPVNAPVAKVKRVFAPANRREQDVVVVSQTNPGFNGKGERLAVDVHSGAGGGRIFRFEYDGDGKDVKCDVSADMKFFAAVGPGDKITVWKLADGSKVFDGPDPFVKAPPAERKSELVAIFFSKSAAELVAVYSDGELTMFGVADKLPRGASAATLDPATGRRITGKNVAVDESHTAVILAVGDTVYQRTIDGGGTLAAGKLELGGQAGRSLGIGAVGTGTGGTTGRLVYAFETDKKAKGLLLSMPGDKPSYVRWPEAAGEPTGVMWAGTRFVVISTDKGALYLDAEEKKFTPVAFAELAGGRVPHAANESGHWYVTADPADPNKSLVVELTTDSLSDFKNTLEGKKDPPTVRLDEKGLSK
jgi:hypothetical protein